MNKTDNSENKIMRKLRDDSGASITFALLLFLVCAALSAVILVAATTAAGRMAGIAESDQRYYSVTSAAELVAEITDGSTVSVVKVDGSYKYFTKPAHEITESDLTSSEKVEPEVDTDAEELVEDVKSKPVYGSLYKNSSGSCPEDLAKLVLGDKSSAQWYLKSSTSDEDEEDALAVTIEGSLNSEETEADETVPEEISSEESDSDGTSSVETKQIKLDVFNASGGPYNSDNMRPYTLRIQITADVKDMSSKIKKIGETEIYELKEIDFHGYTIQSPYDE